MPIERELWSGRRVLITGHTGFKGAWLSLWLQSLGAAVSGVAPGPPSEPSLYALAGVGAAMASEHAQDVRDRAALAQTVARLHPEVVFHLAAQPMVRRSLVDPVATYEVNVMGTVNLLDAVRHAGGSVRAVVLVTSDKCYENRDHGAAPGTPEEDSQTLRSAAGVGEREAAAGDRDDGGAGAEGRDGARPFVEGDPLGGSDPYSSSKACAELVAAAYARSFFDAPDSPRVATARAGNVIGGGDWGQDRLLPDAVRVGSGLAPGPLKVRNPDAVRPWQHVLNPLAGYLSLAQELLRSSAACGPWNFGPPSEDARPVGWVLARLREVWESAPEWVLDRRPNPPEARRLELDSTRARQKLGWRSVWGLERALQELALWHDAHAAGGEMRKVSLDQIAAFQADAGAARQPDGLGVPAAEAWTSSRHF